MIASALCNQVDAARTLVDAKASAQAKTKDGLDALTAALARGNKDMIAAVAPTSNPTIETAVQVLQTKDLKTLAAMVKANPLLATQADANGPVLHRQAILLADPTVLEAVVAMTSYEVKSPFSDKFPALVTAIEANRPQAARTLIKLGASPTRLLSNSTSLATPLDVASKRGASEALQIMSQGARKEILELQSTLFSLGLLKSTPDGAWGAASQAAWEKLKDRVGDFSGLAGPDDAVELAKQFAAHHLRVCNQTGASLYIAQYAKDRLTAWYSIENASCESTFWKRSISTQVKVYIGSNPFLGGSLVGATVKFCTKEAIMNDEPESNVRPPCKAPYKETLFVEISDFSKPLVARFR